MNKKTVWGVLAVIILIGVWWGVSSSGMRNTLVASGHPEWPPIMFQKGGEIDGAGVALVSKIFNEIGIKTRFPYSGAWDEVQMKVRSGEVDVLVAAYKTSEREMYMEYSEAYTTDPVALFVKKNETFPFSNWEGLKSKKGVAMVGDSYGQTFDDFIVTAKLNLKKVETSKEAFDLLENEEVDYFLYSLYAGEDYMKKQNLVGKFESLPTFVNEENFYITISKKSSYVKYMPQVNELIRKYKADGTIDELIKEYSN